jgi:glyoxylase-like metal-dependent hydrolase (beta-lactamase superfamily II)
MRSALHVAPRLVGGAVIHVISEGVSPTPHGVIHSPGVPEAEWREAILDADAEGNVPLGMNAVHIGLDGASILVDTGVEDPQSDWGQHAAETYGIVRTPGVIAGLRSVGIAPDEITHVLITHADGDHFGGAVDERDRLPVPRYRNARYLLNRRDWDGNPALDRPDSELMTRLAPIERLGMLKLVEGTVEVVPGVTMLHAPGETPGHSVVRVESQGEIFYALGDLFLHACQVRHPDWNSPRRDSCAMGASRSRILEAAAREGALAVFAHAPFPAWGRVVRSEQGYRWQSA